MPAPSIAASRSRLIRAPLLVALCMAILPGADFTPPRPYVYVTPADVVRMRDNVAKYAWAQTLYNEAKSVSDANASGKLILGQGNIVGLKTGRNMMAHGLCHLISGEQKYADRAISWLRVYAQNNTNYSSFTSTTSGAADKLGSWYAIFPVVYDMVYDRMAASDRTLITNWLATKWGAGSLGGFESNHSFGQAASKLVTAFALGDRAKMDASTQAFRTHQSGWAGSYFWDPSTQAWKNWYFTCDSAMLVGIVSHNAKRAGYTGIDLLLDPIADGWSLKDGNFKMIYDFSTPLGQVPYQSMWKGGMFLNQTGTYATQALDVLAQRENWPDKETYAWFVHKNPSKKMYGNDWEMFDLWPGLTWGRHIATTPQPRNDSVNHPGRGFAVLKSGHPAGPMTDNTLHAYLMHGIYGTVEGMNLKLYGKGRKLTQERFTSNSWGDFGSGGIYMTEPKPPTPVDIYEVSKSYQAGATQRLWNVDSAHLKIMAFDFRGEGNVTPGSHVRTVATTNEYFWDLYRQHSSAARNCTYVCDGVGNTATASVATGKSFAGNFWVDWAKHMRYWGVAENTSSITLTPYSDLAVKQHFDSAAGTADQYPSENINKLQVKRSGVSGTQDFIGVYEPLGGGTTRLTSVSRFNTTGTAETTAIRVVGLDYTDILAYQHAVGDRILVSGSESLRCFGRYGYIRYHKGTRALIVQGDVSAFTVQAPQATSLVVNGIARTFTQSGDVVSWSAGSTPPADATAPTSPGNLAATSTTTTSITLSWTASTDNVGVTAYDIWRNGNMVATVAGTTHTSTDLNAGTSYAFEVRARDAAGNRSLPATVNATTQTATTDTQAPSQPGALTATATGSSTVTLSWTAATDNVAVTGYEVSRNGVLIATASGSSYADSGLTPATLYSYAVQARDAAGNRSAAATASATTATAQTAQNAFTRIEAESLIAQNGLIIVAGGSGMKIGSIENNTWAAYVIDFGSGAASCQMRASSNTKGGTIELRLGSTSGTLIGTCAVPATGGWNNFVDLTCTVSGVTGTQALYLVFKGGGGSLLDVDWFQFTASTLPSSSSFATIQAEDFSAMKGVSINDADTGKKIGNIQASDWVRFDDIDFGTGASSVSARVASPTNGGNIQFRLGSSTGPLLATVPVPITGGWNSFTISSAAVGNVSGIHDLYLVFTGGSGSLFDVDWFRFTPAGTSEAMLAAPLAPLETSVVESTDQESSAGGCGSGFGIAFLLAALACVPLRRSSHRCSDARRD